MSDLGHALLSGRLTTLTVLVWTLLSMLMSIGAGALAGMVLAGKDLGNNLAALFGALYGPLAAVPGVLLGLVVLAFV